MLQEFSKMSLVASFLAVSAPAFAEEAEVTCPQDKVVSELTDDERDVCLGNDAQDEDDDEIFEVRLHGSLNDTKAKTIIEDLREYAAEDPDKEITFYINSPGGSLGQAFAIYDVMQSIPNDVRTVCENMAMSAGMLLLAAGTEGKREALPNCSIMTHQSSGGVMGHIEDRNISMEFRNEQNDRALSIISLHTGWNQAFLRDLASHDIFLTAEQAVEMNFIDNVIEPLKAAPNHEERSADDLPDWFCQGARADVVRACVMK